jgi:tetratricopeptide (TPR) repeat protein
MLGHSSAIVFGANSSQKELARDILSNLNFIYIHTPDEISDAKNLLTEDLEAPLIVFWDSMETKAQIILESLDEIDVISLRAKIIVNTNIKEDFSELWSELQISDYVIEQLTEKSLTRCFETIDRSTEEASEYWGCLQRASEKLIIGDIEKAVDYLTGYDQEDENFHQVLMHAAYVLLHAKKAIDAKGILEAHKENYEHCPRFLDLLGRCYLASRDFDKAASYFEKAFQQNGNHVTRRLNLAKSLLYAGQYHEALDAYCAIQNPNVINLVLPGKVKSLLLLDKHDDALALLEEAEDQQQVASMLNVAAVMAINHGFQEKGLELFAMSVKILHDDWASLSKFGFNMGIAYFKQKDFENAGRCFGLAVALDPENSQAAENFSMLADLVSVDEIPEKRGEALEALARYDRSA